MARKVFQDFANTLPHMLVGWRMTEDLERIAELPDGVLTIDVLKGTTTHSAVGDLTLYIAGELQAWLARRMAESGIPADLLDLAQVIADIRTDRIATDRKRIVAFDFDCKATLVSGTRTYRGTLVEKHAWHSRIDRDSGHTHFVT